VKRTLLAIMLFCAANISHADVCTFSTQQSGAEQNSAVRELMVKLFGSYNDIYHQSVWKPSIGMRQTLRVGGTYAITQPLFLQQFIESGQWKYILVTKTAGTNSDCVLGMFAFNGAEPISKHAAFRLRAGDNMPVIKVERIGATRHGIRFEFQVSGAPQARMVMVETGTLHAILAACTLNLGEMWSYSFKEGKNPEHYDLVVNESGGKMLIPFKDGRYSGVPGC
jgi:hypothetical protein